MNEFKCRCGRCHKEDSYEDLKAAYMDGWNFGKNAICWDCQKKYKIKEDLDSPVTLE